MEKLSLKCFYHKYIQVQYIQQYNIFLAKYDTLSHLKQQ